MGRGSFAEALGELVIAWNVAEMRVRDMLANFCSRENTYEGLMASLILTVELGGVGMSNALHAIAGDILEGDEADAVKHVAIGSDTLRAYRNYYVHGVVSTLTDDAGEAGNIETVSAKGAYISHREVIEIAEVRRITEHLEALTVYTDGVLSHLFWPPTPAQRLRAASIAR